MVIDRRDNVISGNLLKIFIKLLDYGEVKLILPNVIKVETYRHLDSEIKCVGKKIDSTMDSIKNLGKEAMPFSQMFELISNSITTSYFIR